MGKRIPSITRSQVSAFLKPRAVDSHKGQFGRVLVIGGDVGMVGAALIAARAALKLGAGAVHVGLLAENAPTVDLVQPELMLLPAETALRQLDPDVIAIGCGLGTSRLAYKLLLQTLQLKVPLVLDADALNLIALHPDLQDDLRARNEPSILTPHPGEAAHLLNLDTKSIQDDRMAAARQLAEQFLCSVVLKGAGSLCIDRLGKPHLNTTGNPGMSSPGMGDALTGMIAAFIAQGQDADQAMLLAVHLHGAAGDALAEQQAMTGMTATEVTEWARWLLNQWLRVP
jgi:ADP-dependent NAD(P)H-hydrate dehydratase / NAD(P)H-hydrate epimerase